MVSTNKDVRLDRSAGFTKDNKHTSVEGALHRHSGQALQTCWEDLSQETLLQSFVPLREISQEGYLGVKLNYAEVRVNSLLF